MFLYKKKRAMSLAELIAVMAIIGVVSALTLPGLKKHSQMVDMGSLAKKAYSNIEDILDNSVTENGPIREWDFANTSKISGTCFTPYIKTSGGGAASDGMKYSLSGCNGSLCLIDVDVNGKKPPNRAGKDKFQFQINKDDENLVPTTYGGTDVLRKNNWKFTQQMWDS